MCCKKFNNFFLDEYFFLILDGNFKNLKLFDTIYKNKKYYNNLVYIF